MTNKNTHIDLLTEQEFDLIQGIYCDLLLCMEFDLHMNFVGNICELIFNQHD